jgi:hypothetical protein
VNRIAFCRSAAEQQKEHLHYHLSLADRKQLFIINATVFRGVFAFGRGTIKRFA